MACSNVRNFPAIGGASRLGYDSPMQFLASFLVAAVLAASPESRVDPDRLMAHVRELPPNRTAWATPAEQETLAQTEELVRAKLRELGFDPVEQPLAWSNGGVARVKTEEGWSFVPDPTPRTWRNYFVEIPGADLAQEVILVGAHFDTHPGTPGADDNATGVAAALELARVLKNEPMRRTVRIVFFNLEEIGLVGSREHAQWTRERIDAGDETIVGMMSIEMIGYYSDEPNSQRSPIPAIPNVFDPPTVGDFLSVLAVQNSAPFARALADAMRAAEPELPIGHVDFIPGDGALFRDVRRSDQAPFWDIGVPAVMITDTSEFRNPHYHKATDTWETLDAKRFTLAARAITGAVWRLAEPVDVASSE